MQEFSLFGVPVSLLFLYFIFYSFVGWAMETTYCSILERRFVVRGFLYGPICPIYGVGALMMILFFQPLTENLILFYLVSTVSMSAWEYFVGWFLEVTTHMKYWDYSSHRFNLHGRISLFICLWWGVLSYITIFLVHPPVARLFGHLAVLPRQIIALALFLVLASDAAVTIRNLALTAKLIRKLEQAGDELALQMALAKLEARDRLNETKEDLNDRLNEAIIDMNTRIAAAQAELRGALAEARDNQEQSRAAMKKKYPQLWERYTQLLERTERTSRHLRRTYHNLSSSRYTHALETLKENAESIRQEFSARRKKSK